MLRARRRGLPGLQRNKAEKRRSGEAEKWRSSAHLEAEEGEEEEAIITRCVSIVFSEIIFLTSGLVELA